MLRLKSDKEPPKHASRIDGVMQPDQIAIEQVVEGVKQAHS